MTVDDLLIMFKKAYNSILNWKHNIESPPEKYFSRFGKESNKHKPWCAGKKRQKR